MKSRDGKSQRRTSEEKVREEKGRKKKLKVRENLVFLLFRVLICIKGFANMAIQDANSSSSAKASSFASTCAGPMLAVFFASTSRYAVPPTKNKGPDNPTCVAICVREAGL